MVSSSAPGCRREAVKTETLLTRDRQGKLQPGLAVSYKALNDTTWQIKLREGVRFHNGEPLDAGAVRFSIARALDPAVKSVFASSLDTIARVDVVDPSTVNIVTKAPDPILPSRLCMQQGQILPPKYATDVGAEGLAKRPVGAGPYRFVSWRKDEAITLEAVPDHWRKPKIAKVVFRPVPEFPDPRARRGRLNRRPRLVHEFNGPLERVLSAFSVTRGRHSTQPGRRLAA